MKKILALLIAGSALASCAIQSESSNDIPKEITLIAYDAFTPEKGVFDDFTTQYGPKVNVVTAGDTGAMVSKAILTAGNPEGDVIFGIDNTFISRAVSGKVLDEYQAVDEGDVCVNFDKSWFASRNIAVPTTFEDFVKPQYKGLLSVEDPVNSAPGFAFLLASIHHFGEDRWQTYWKQLKANSVRVSADWTSAYTADFSGSTGKGKYPLVVSYGSSPPAEVMFAEIPLTDAPTGVITSTCFHSVEYVGMLRGTKHQKMARALVEYLLAKKFQESMPTTLFVYPVNKAAVLPEVFTKYAVRPTTTETFDAATIEKNRDGWIDAWRNIFL